MTSNDAPFTYPSLPIVTPDPPRGSQIQKYGLALYLGLGGLVVLLSLIGWFGWRVWSMRAVWRNVYVLNDRRAPAELRLQAALELGRDPRFEPRQLWDLSLHRDLPDLARYLLAEAIGPDLVAADPIGYASAVARSDGWPPWLRLVLARPMAYAASQGHTLPRERLAELCRLKDSQLRLWALYTLAMQPNPDPAPRAEILQISRDPGPDRQLAALLETALEADAPGRRHALDQATAWTHVHHPAVRLLWDGWTLDGDGIRRAAPSP